MSDCTSSSSTSNSSSSSSRMRKLSRITYRIVGNFSGYKLSRIKGEASFRDSYFHDQDGVARTKGTRLLLETDSNIASILCFI